MTAADVPPMPRRLWVHNDAGYFCLTCDTRLENVRNGAEPKPCPMGCDDEVTP